jgi:pimeloyl-[acyl-carrier protein] methyl ester esterase
MDGTGSLFEPFLRCLPKGTDVKIVTYPEQFHLTYRQLEERVISELPVGKPYTIIAESFSGPIALRIATRVSGDLRSVVLVSSFAYQPLGWIGSLIARLPLAFILRVPPSDWALRTFLLNSSASPHLLRCTRAAIGRVRPEVLAARLRDALTAKYCGSRIDCQTRIAAIFSKDDRLLGRHARQSILRVCPRTEMEIVAAPHFALQTAPIVVVDALRKLKILH